MKNTLAENMLRFGVKNLSESDVKRIEESTLNEDVVINGTTYKFPFKDANHLNTSYLGPAAPWTETQAANAGRFNVMDSADKSTLGTFRGLYADMLLDLAKRGITPDQLKAMGAARVLTFASQLIASPDANLAPVAKFGGWANVAAIRTNALNPKNPKVIGWVNNWFMPTFEKAFNTAFPQGIETPKTAPTTQPGQ